MGKEDLGLGFGEEGGRRFKEEEREARGRCALAAMATLANRRSRGDAAAPGAQPAGVARGRRGKEATDVWARRGKKRSKFEIQNGGAHGLKNSRKFFWRNIKSPRTFSNKNHSKSFYSLVAEKRTK